MWRKIRTIFTFKMKLTIFCDVIYCIKKCFFLLIWIWIFFPQAREQELNNRRVYLIPDSFSRWHQMKIKMELFPFGSGYYFDPLISKLTFLYFKFFCNMKNDMLFERFASFVSCIFYYNIDILFFKAVIFYWRTQMCICFRLFLMLLFYDFSFFCICLKYLKYINWGRSNTNISIFFPFVSTFIEIIDLLSNFFIISFRVRSFKVIYMIVCLTVVDVVNLLIFGISAK